MHWIRSFVPFLIFVCSLFCVDGIKNRECREHKKMPTTKINKINTSTLTKTTNSTRTIATSTATNKTTNTTPPSGLL